MLNWRLCPTVQEKSIPGYDTLILLHTVFAVEICPLRLPLNELVIEPVVHPAGHFRIECFHWVHWGSTPSGLTRSY
jgi:hypothetical protein